MRSLLLAALASSLLVSQIRTADACGGGGSYFVGPLLRAHVVNHSFAVLDERLPPEGAATMKWTRVEPLSYDHTKTAPGAKLSAPLAFTAIGPSGIKVFESKQTTWINLAFDRDDSAHLAVKLPAGDYPIVLEGRWPNAKWESLQVVNGDTVTAYSGKNVQFVVGMDGKFELGGSTVEGTPLGILTAGQGRYLVIGAWSGSTAVVLHSL